MDLSHWQRCTGRNKNSHKEDLVSFLCWLLIGTEHSDMPTDGFSHVAGEGQQSPNLAGQKECAQSTSPSWSSGLMNPKYISLGDRVSGWLSGFPETITNLALRELFGGAEIREAFRVRKGRGCTRRSALKESPDHSEEEFQRAGQSVDVLWRSFIIYSIPSALITNEYSFWTLMDSGNLSIFWWGLNRSVCLKSHWQAHFISLSLREREVLYYLKDIVLGLVVTSNCDDRSVPILRNVSEAPSSSFISSF